MCESPSVLLRTRPPVGEEGEEVGGADVAEAAAEGGQQVVSNA